MSSTLNSNAQHKLQAALWNEQTQHHSYSVHLSTCDWIQCNVYRMCCVCSVAVGWKLKRLQDTEGGSVIVYSFLFWEESRKEPTCKTHAQIRR